MLPDVSLAENTVVEEYWAEENERDYQEYGHCDNVGKDIASEGDLSHACKVMKVCSL
jgi:hypothetical protein